MAYNNKLIKLKGFVNFFLFLFYFSILLLNFSNFAYAQVDTKNNQTQFNWQETDSGVISNTFITSNETYTYDEVAIKFLNLPSENLKLSITKIDQNALPNSTKAQSNAYDIKLLDENNNEVTEDFYISVTFHQIENTENISVISFENIENINNAITENFEIDDGKIIVETNHLTIFLVTKIIDHTSGGGEVVLSNTPPDDPLPVSINVNNSSDTGALKIKGYWQATSTDIGVDYVDFHFEDITETDAINSINFITNERIQVAGGAGGVDNTDFDAKLYAKKNDGNFVDLLIDKNELVPNFSTGGSSANYDLITIPIDSSYFTNLDLTDFVIRYSLAGRNLGPYPTSSRLVSYFDYVALDVQYTTDTTAPTVDLVFPTPSASATSFQAVFSEDVNQTEAENPANYFLNNWPSTGESGDLVGDATIVYNSSSFTATITFTNASWYISPEQQWGVQDIHDLAGNLLQTTPYTKYSTPMVAPITTDSGIDTNWRSTPVTVTLTCTDTNGSGCKTTYYTTDGTNPNLTSSTGNSFTLSTEGTYTIKYFSTDNAGNVESIQTATNQVQIDTTEPSGTVVINSDDTYTNNKTVTLAITSTDNLSGVSEMTFSNDDITYSGWEAFSTTKTWDLENTDGTKTVYIKLKDLAGNESTTSDSIILDTTLPLSIITTPNNTSNNSTTYLDTWNGVIAGTSSDTLSGIKKVQFSIQRSSNGFYFNGTDWVSSASEILLNTVTSDLYANWNYDLNPDPAGNETYTIISHATDNAGNFESSYTLTLIYDIEIPQVTLSINPTNPNGDNGIYISKPKITLTANDNYNVDYIEYQINSTTGTWTKYIGEVTVNEGITKFYYRSTDKAGNISNIGLKNVSVDLTPPGELENVNASYNSTLSENTVTWDINNDDIYTIKVYKSENSNIDQSSSNFFVTVDKNADNITDDHVDREHTYYYLLVTYDEAGNEGDSVKVSISIPENEEENIEVTTETIPVPIIVVPNTITPTKEEGQVEGAATENENIDEEKVLGENDVNIDLGDTKNDSRSIGFLIKYWWLFLLTPIISWLLWWIYKRNKLSL